jgi:magnesium chelatase subunit I
MNPEEGDIRPQLLDRFGLSVTVAGEGSPERRMEVIKRRLAYEQAPEEFSGQYREEQAELAAKILSARQLLPRIEAADDLLLLAAQMAIALDVDGHRADITVIKTALTLAAFDGREQATPADMKTAARLALPHRMRRRPFEDGVLDWEKIDALFAAP